jgi:hypothetical protein
LKICETKISNTIALFRPRCKWSHCMVTCQVYLAVIIENQHGTVNNVLR